MQQHHLLIRMPCASKSPTVSPQRNGYSPSPQRQNNSSPLPSAVPVATQPRNPTPLPSAPGSRAVSPLSSASVSAPTALSYPQLSATAPAGPPPSTAAVLSIRSNTKSQTGESPAPHLRDVKHAPNRAASPLLAKKAKVIAAVAHEKSPMARNASSSPTPEAEGKSKAGSDPVKTASVAGARKVGSVPERTKSPVGKQMDAVRLSKYTQISPAGAAIDSMPPGPLLRGRKLESSTSVSPTPERTSAAAPANISPNVRRTTGQAKESKQASPLLATNSSVGSTPTLSGVQEQTVAPNQQQLDIELPTTYGILPPGSVSIPHPGPPQDVQVGIVNIATDLRKVTGPPSVLTRSLSPTPSRRSASMLLPIARSQSPGSLTIPSRRPTSPVNGVVRSISATPLRSHEYTVVDRLQSIPGGSMKVAGPGSFNVRLNWPPQSYCSSSLPPWAMSQSPLASQTILNTSPLPSTVSIDMSATPDLGKSRPKTAKSPLRSENDRSYSFITEEDFTTAGSLDTVSPMSNEKELRHLLQKPETARIMENMMKDLMLETVERHTDKIVSALLAISDQRVDDVAKNAQQSEERLRQIMTLERQERQEMFAALQQHHEQTRTMVEAKNSRMEAVSQEVATLRTLVSAEDCTRSLQQLAGPQEWNSFMEQEREDWRKSFEELESKIESQKVYFEARLAEEKARADNMLQESQLLFSGEMDSSGASFQMRAFKTMLDQRIKDVACTIDQLIKDFANSLEAERAQRQEGDRLSAAMARDLSKYKERLESLFDEVEASKHVRPTASGKSFPVAGEESLRGLEGRIQEICRRMDSFELSRDMSNSRQIDSERCHIELETLVEQRVDQASLGFKLEQREAVASLQSSINQIRDALSRSKDTRSPSPGDPCRQSDQLLPEQVLKRRMPPC